MSFDDDLGEFDFPLKRYSALYDYTYKDDDGSIIEMHQGDEYHLLQKSGEWWEVIRSDGANEESSFYVPANYVSPIDGEEDSDPDYENSDEKRVDPKKNNNLSHTSSEAGNRLEEDNTPVINLRRHDGVIHTKGNLLGSAMGEPLYSNLDNNQPRVVSTHSTFGKISQDENPTGQHKNNNNIVVRSGKLRQSLDLAEEGDYANLDEYRKTAGLPPSTLPKPTPVSLKNWLFRVL